MPNRLAEEKSLYLQQHADNLVEWHPWGPEALKLARETDRPLLVSIGYSSCHWCHVMAHESFDNPFIAQVMNQHFVCVKIDREERPDLDQIFMEAVQMITQQGGWPLHAFCFPDGRPFFGGTYFPPEDRGNGMVPWPQLLMRVADYYRRNRSELEENALSIVQNLNAANTPIVQGPGTIDQQLLIQAGTTLAARHDGEYGGFGEAPKFPPSKTIQFLQVLQQILRLNPKDEAQQNAWRNNDKVIQTTLRAMAHGGIFDQIGGGFARYSVDQYWLIPHFEKMLYDNGLLLQTYARAWQGDKEPLYKAIVEETITWLQREMQLEDGGFAASIDADSEGEEGKYYIWSPSEVKQLLGEPLGHAFCLAYNITDEGNFEDGLSNPALTETDSAIRQRLRDARARLLQARQQRVKPVTDRKRLLSWNALIVQGLAEAAFAFDRDDWYDLARKTADFFHDHCRLTEGGLAAVFYDEPCQPAFIDDYAFLAQAWLQLAAYADVFEPGTSQECINKSIQLAEDILERFNDLEAPGFFFAQQQQTDLLTRKKEWWDNATPSGNATLLHVFSNLYSLTGDDKWEKEFIRLTRAYPGKISGTPLGVPYALEALASRELGIEVIKAAGVPSLDKLAELVRDQPWRRRFLILSKDKKQPKGYQRCIGTHCEAPVERPQKLFLGR